MLMKVKAGTPQEDIEMFCKRASKLTLAQVIERVSVTEELKASGDARRIQYTVDIDFFPEEEYRTEYDVEAEEILGCFSVKFPLTLKREIITEMKRLDEDVKKQMAELGKGKKVSDAADDDEGGDAGDAEPRKKRSDDEESEVGDGDADDEKRARQKKQQATYEDDDDDEDEAELNAYSDHEIAAEFASDDEVEVKPVPKKTQDLQRVVKTVAMAFANNLSSSTSFAFDGSRCTFVLEVSASMDLISFVPDLILVQLRYAQTAIHRCY